jgi:hypothetical protein
MVLDNTLRSLSTSPCAKSRRATSSFPSATRASPRSASRAPIATRARSRRSSARLAAIGDVTFRELGNRIHPRSHIGELRGLLPEKYSPLRAIGDGLQSVYLIVVGPPFAAALLRLIGGEANKVADVVKEVDRAE